MTLKRSPCENWKLYVITDAAAANGKDVADVVRAAIRGGADVIQLRDKHASDAELVKAAKRLLAVTRTGGVPLIINDRIAVARDCGAEGVHLGQDDASYSKARAMLGSAAIIGRSTHSPEQALAAEEEGFDYIGIGPVFGTPTKPEYKPVGLELVSYASRHIHIPFIAIGGIDTTNVKSVRKAGARTIAVVRAVMAASDPEQAASELKRNLE